MCIRARCTSDLLQIIKLQKKTCSETPQPATRARHGSKGFWKICGNVLATFRPHWSGASSGFVEWKQNGRHQKLLYIHIFHMRRMQNATDVSMHHGRWKIEKWIWNRTFFCFFFVFFSFYKAWRSPRPVRAKRCINVPTDLSEVFGTMSRAKGRKENR